MRPVDCAIGVLVVADSDGPWDGAEVCNGSTEGGDAG